MERPSWHLLQDRTAIPVDTVRQLELASQQLVQRLLNGEIDTDHESQN